MRRLTLLLLATLLSHVSFAEVVKLDNYRGWSDCYSISNKESKIIICPSAGGRLLYYSIDGENIIYENPDFDGVMLEELKKKRIWPDGGRFDIGPEALPASMRDELMMGRWEAKIVDDYSVEISFTRDNTLGVHATRRFSLSKRGAKLTLTQTMTNCTDEPLSRHYWGRVFCKGGGTVYLPLDSKDGWGSMGGHSTKGAVVEGSVLRVKLGDDTIRKVGSNSQKGWIAYSVDGMKITQRFKCSKDANYSDTEDYTTIFYSNSDICEVEPVSPTIYLQPGESHTFKQKWKLEKL